MTDNIHKLEALHSSERKLQIFLVPASIQTFDFSLKISFIVIE